MYTSRLSMSFGVVSEASKFWKPPMPTRFIHSRSSLMPSLVMLPFIQCHQTRGLAELGGFLNPSSSDGGFCAAADTARANSMIAKVRRVRESLIGSSLSIWLATPDGLDPGEKTHNEFAFAILPNMTALGFTVRFWVARSTAINPNLGV